MNLPALGQGTWHMAEKQERRRSEIQALRLGVDLRLSSIDTAQIMPTERPRSSSAKRSRAIATRCSSSPSFCPITRHAGALSSRVKRASRGCDEPTDMADLLRVDAARSVRTEQVLYNNSRIGSRVRPLACRELGIDATGYSPFEQGLLARNDTLAEIGLRTDATPAQVALAWVLRQDGVAAIAKASTPEQVREDARRARYSSRRKTSQPSTLRSLRRRRSSRSRCTE